MEKKGMFKKIDEFYTKVTQKIIGDMPLDDDNPSNKKATNKKKSNTPIRTTFGAVKEKLLNLGTSKDEKTLLYKEVVKKEKQEAKNYSN